MDIKSAKLRVTMPDGSQWDVPVAVIARNRAQFYRENYESDEDALAATYALFEDNNFEIEDWITRANNMNWSDVKEHATRAVLPPSGDADYDDGWANGDKEVVL